MKRTTLFVLGILFFSRAISQDQITTFILLRHAEKVQDGTKDPELSEVGKQRALLLDKLLNDQSIDAIYSTAFARTQSTVKPLADSKKLEVFPYESRQPEAINNILTKHKGGTVVVCGHSNTIPWTVNYLIGENRYPDFEDGDYGNLIIVNLVEKGKVAKITWLNY